jgi:2-methylcitrate dehydratase PrpD
MENKISGPTFKLAEGLAKLHYADLPQEVIEKTKLLLLDYIGYTLFACEKEDFAEMIMSLIRDLGGNPEATVLGYGIRTSVLLASFANGAMGHMTELDDTHIGTASHPGDSIIPAALALGERKKITGKDLLLALVAGYEADLRIGEAVQPTHVRRGFHSSATINTFGAAISSGKVLDFNAQQMAGVMGLAGLQAAGCFYYLTEKLTMPKDFNTGRAAMSGVLSALLIAKGFQAGKTVLENDMGFCKLYADPSQIKLDRISYKIGELFKIMEMGHKFYSSCRHIHAAIDATLKLMKEHEIAVEYITKINAKIYKTGAIAVDDPEPWLRDAQYGTRFSAQFNIALAILEGEDGISKLLIHDCQKEKLNDLKIRALMKKIVVIHDEELDKNYGKARSTIIDIETKYGNYTCRVDHPKGDPENPGSYEELVIKFKTLSRNVLDTATQDQVIATVNQLEKAKDINILVGLLVKK